MVDEGIVNSTPNGYMLRQYSYPDNSEGKSMPLSRGIGTGGTISGTGRFLKEKNPNIKATIQIVWVVGWCAGDFPCGGERCLSTELFDSIRLIEPPLPQIMTQALPLWADLRLVHLPSAMEATTLGHESS
ncbi:hypothetical protein Pint_20568 [Pistacia integerrima]|uniref:Uncharacterized protein n=1 Tax=Pistacia integerrima TaxID=434235 RepID=A0ACC0XCG7_9ROSI|nr:hypothetical protein Pint_20568 [Pistacia integerrima]